MPIYSYICCKKAWGGGSGLSNLKEILFSPTMLTFVIGTTFIYLFSINIIAHQWDEFSHWAITVEDMYYRHRLSTDAQAMTGFNSYPPAMALWQFLFVVFAPEWNDGVIYFAYNLFLFLMMLPILQNITWKRAILSIPALAIIFILPYYVSSIWESAAWHTLYIDHALAMTFCHVFLSYFSFPPEKAHSRIGLFYTGISMAVLSLIKNTGSMLAGIAFVIILFDFSLFNKEKTASSVYGGNKKRFRAMRLFWMLIPYAVAVVSWKVYLTLIDAFIKWAQSGNNILALVLELIRGKAPEWRYEVAHAFFAQMFEPISTLSSGINITFIGLIFIWFGLSIAIVCFEKKSIKRYLCVWAGVTIGYFVYLGGLLYSYLYVFSQSEGEHLAGIYRYVGSYSLGILAFFLISCFQRITECRNRKVLLLGSTLLSVGVLLTAPLSSIYIEMIDAGDELNTTYTVSGFYTYKTMQDQIKNPLHVSDKIYYIGCTGANWYIVNKVFMPARYMVGDESFAGNESFEGSLEEWKSMLRDSGCTYVYVDSLSDEMDKKYSSATMEGKLQENTLYAIDYEQEGVTILKKVLTFE